MIPANPKIYDHARFFDDYNYVDWKQCLKFEVGDIVYLYCSKPFQKVMYKIEVIKESMSFSECTEDEDYWNEGAVTTTTVNKYERNPLARKKCIEYHGCECSVCGLSFEKMYGDLGKGFIHVHHIVPLNQINEEYEVNYKTDLIPVCPNCHAMLHRKVDSDYYSIDELKLIVKKS